MYVRCDESSLYSRINYVPQRLTGNFSAGVSGELLDKTCTQGLARTRIYVCQRGADTEETDVAQLAWKDLCSVLNILSKY